MNKFTLENNVTDNLEKDPELIVNKKTKKAIETYLRLKSFAEDWDAPGMEIYYDEIEKLNSEKE